MIVPHIANDQGGVAGIPISLSFLALEPFAILYTQTKVKMNLLFSGLAFALIEIRLIKNKTLVQWLTTLFMSDQ